MKDIRSIMFMIWMVVMTALVLNLYMPHPKGLPNIDAYAATFSLTKPDSGAGTIRIKLGDKYSVPGFSTDYTAYYKINEGAIGNRTLSYRQWWSGRCGIDFLDWHEGVCDLDDMQYSRYEGRNYDAICPNGSVAVGITTGMYWGNRYVYMPVCRELTLTTAAE